MRRRVIIASVVAGVVVVTASAGGLAYVNHRGQVRLDQDARTSADRFAGAWSHRDVHDLAYAGWPADQAAASFKSTTAGLGSMPVKVTLTSLTREGDKANGSLSVSWTAADDATWAYQMPISVAKYSAAKASGSSAPIPVVANREAAFQTSRHDQERQWPVPRW